MPFIGIIASKKDIKAIQKEIPNTKIELIEINEKSIENLKNIKFETIIITKKLPLLEKKKESLKEILKQAKYLIINSDEDIIIPNDNNILIITYGFNQKATLTISSITEDKVLICLQRNIKKENGKFLEMQEENIKLEEHQTKKIYNILLVFIINKLHNA